MHQGWAKFLGILIVRNFKTSLHSILEGASAWILSLPLCGVFPVFPQAPYSCPGFCGEFYRVDHEASQCDGFLSLFVREEPGWGASSVYLLVQNSLEGGHFSLFPLHLPVYYLTCLEWRCLIKRSEVKVAQSCPTLCDPMNYTVHGILQARILEWVAFPFSRGPSQPSDWTQVSCIAGRFFTSWATREAQEYCSG